MVAIGLPLVIHGLNVVINQWVGIGIPRQDFSSIAGWLLIFGVRLINPVNGPVGRTWMARIRPPRPTGDALAAILHGDPRRARSISHYCGRMSSVPNVVRLSI